MTEYETKSLALLERIANAVEGKSSGGQRPASGGGAVLPNYGKSKGAPVAGASMDDLEYYATGAKRSLADASKSRWHDKERELLAAINAEIEKQGGKMRPPDDAPPPGWDDAPRGGPAQDDIAF